MAHVAAKRGTQPHKVSQYIETQYQYQLEIKLSNQRKGFIFWLTFPIISSEATEQSSNCKNVRWEN